jgi:hypothetical protein
MRFDRVVDWILRRFATWRLQIAVAQSAVALPPKAAWIQRALTIGTIFLASLIPSGFAARIASRM